MREEVRVGVLVILLLGATVSVVPFTGSALGGKQLGVNVNSPSQVTVGNSVSFGGSISVPDIPGTHQGNLKITVSVDGNQITSKTVQVHDGKTKQFSVTHQFSSAGTHTIKVTGSISIDRFSLSHSSSTTIDVVQPKTTEKSTTTPTTTTSFRPIFKNTKLGVHLNHPSEISTSQTTNLGGTISLPNLPGSHTVDGKVLLLIDGKQVASKSVSVTDGGTAHSSFNHHFSTSGTHTITLQAKLSANSRSITGSVSKSITVSKGGVSTSNTAINTSISGQSSTIKGAAFPLPTSLQNQLNSYRKKIPKHLPQYAFVLASKNHLQVVFTKSKPQKGIAKVSGLKLHHSIKSKGVTFGAVLAQQVSYKQSGSQETVAAVNTNPNQYRLKLVHISAPYRRVSLLSDPDPGNGTDVILPTTVGVLTRHRVTAHSILQNIGSSSSRFATESPSQIVTNRLHKATNNRLKTISFTTNYWLNSSATVNGVVLNPSGPAARYLKQFDPNHIQLGSHGQPTLYVVNTKLNPHQFSGISQLKKNARKYNGKTVSVTANLYGKSLSPQETLTSMSSCPKSNEIGQGGQCVPDPTDAPIQGGIAWNGVPQSRNDTLFVMGASSIHQDQPTAQLKGQYHIVGKVISTSRISKSLPRGSMLVIYRLHKTGPIPKKQLEKQAGQLVLQRSTELASTLRQNIVEKSQMSLLQQAQAKQVSLKPNHPVTVSFSSKTTAAVNVNSIQITTKSSHHTSIDVKPVLSPPSNVSSEPNHTIQMFHLTTKISDKDIQRANIKITVAKSDIPQGRTPVVYRYHGGQWKALNTTIVSTSGSHDTVEATTPGFSYYAIGTTGGSSNSQASGATTSPTQTQQSTTASSATSGSSPGFTVVTAIGALLILILKLSR